MKQYSLAGLFVILFTLLGGAGLKAQSLTVTGTVEDADGPLIGVSIMKKGTSSGTVTDLDGGFTIQAEPEDILVFSYIGYGTLEVPVGDQRQLQITMDTDANQLDEIVVVGYGSQKKSDLTGAVSQVSGTELGKFPVANATESLQGRLAGVRIESAGGAPGAGAFVTIRGSGTLSNAQPLYVIDGILTGSMDNLNPADIESVSVLKDASASAIYGSRAANGVVIVTTKKGSPNGGLTIEADLSAGVQSAINRIDWANAGEYALIRNRANDNDGTNRSPANDVDFDPTVDTDIQDLSLRTGAIYNTGLRLSGGSELFTFSVSGNYLDETGVVRESSYNKANVRVNSTFTKGRFRLEESIGLTRTENNPNYYFNSERDILPTAAFRNPDFEGGYAATSDPSGSTAIHGVGNMRNSLAQAILEDRTITSNGLLGNVAASFEIIDGLTYKLSASLDQGNTNNYRFTPTYFFNATAVGRQNFAELNETNSEFTSTIIENTLNYERELAGRHRINLLAGYTRQVSTGRTLGIVARDFPSNSIRVASTAQNLASAPSFEFKSALLSSFGRVNYAYDDRYLLTATLRRDASSLFREDLRAGVFPSVAIGWNVGKESFFNADGFINDLKLRLSYGEIGSNNTQAYEIDPVLNLFGEYPLGTNQTRRTGYSVTKGVNDAIKWETTTTTDIGMEASFLDSRLSVTMDYFIKNTNDILVRLSIPRFTGFDNDPTFNAASIRNKGFEFGANYGKFTGDFNWSLGANLTLLDNEVTDLPSDPIVGGQFTSNGLRSTRTEVGQPIGSFYGYEVAGIYRSDAEAAEDGRTDARAGDFKFRDINGDGMLTDADQTYLGSPIPTFEYGLNANFFWRSFDATLLFNGVAGNKILNANIYRGYFDTEGNYLADAVNAWTPENSGSRVPRNTLVDQAFNRRMSDFYLESGAYFRLRNLQIGYSLPAGLLEGTNAISKIRAYVNVQNLFTITDYTGYYPEPGRNSRGGTNIFNAGVDESAYPMPRTFMFGLQLGF
ncbi:TonB-dependent receptor [Lewinella sp. JB7]|uniref:SusC/RagA family TonB-linked outer membrane protein n=1 Tax=Lewinella sp. JB7 TaxID=2962887 RepID=UPI0020C9665A|nr:TonB-dependent receptor [Lewinella sp. JB7]MCP9235839.1 TonB-dependent receptor [Lewinella sp. JB7]